MIDPDQRLALCQQAARVVIDRHNWRLLDPSSLALAASALMESAMASAGAMAQAERACQQVYAQTLYLAAQDPARQTAAYSELHAYLYRIAQHQRPELAEDAAQEAILGVFQTIASCREPRAFLKFAIYQLMTAFRRLAPQNAAVSAPLEWDAPVSQEGESFGEQMAGSADTQSEVEQSVRAGELLRWLRAVVAANPRARNQILAVVMKYLEGRDDADIAAALDTTVANVHVLRSRGLEKLRQVIGETGDLPTDLPQSARFPGAQRPGP